MQCKCYGNSNFRSDSLSRGSIKYNIKLLMKKKKTSHSLCSYSNRGFGNPLKKNLHRFTTITINVICHMQNINRQNYPLFNLGLSGETIDKFYICQTNGDLYALIQDPENPNAVMLVNKLGLSKLEIMNLMLHGQQQINSEIQLRMTAENQKYNNRLVANRYELPTLVKLSLADFTQLTNLEKLYMQQHTALEQGLLEHYTSGNLTVLINKIRTGEINPAGMHSSLVSILNKDSNSSWLSIDRVREDWGVVDLQHNRNMLFNPHLHGTASSQDPIYYNSLRVAGEIRIPRETRIANDTKITNKFNFNATAIPQYLAMKKKDSNPLGKALLRESERVQTIAGSPPPKAIANTPYNGPFACLSFSTLTEKASDFELKLVVQPKRVHEFIIAMPTEAQMHNEFIPKKPELFPNPSFWGIALMISLGAWSLTTMWSKDKKKLS